MAAESRDGIEINGVAHVILRVSRIAECISFYDQVMPFLGLKPVPPRSDFFVYYVGGRTALAIREAESLSFRDPEGIRLELNHVPGPGLLAEGAAFNPAPDHPIEGQPRA